MFEFQRTIRIDSFLVPLEPLKALPDLVVAIILGLLPLSAAVFVLYLNYQKWRHSPFRDLPYPPGPPVMLGDSMNAIKSRPWLAYADLAKTYGDIMYLNVCGEHTVILNSLEDTFELLEKRSRLYSSRKSSKHVEMVGWDFNTGLLPYDVEWRRHRKLYQQCFRVQEVPKYTPIQTAKIHRFLVDLLKNPNSFLSHCKSSTTAIIGSLLYGHDLTEESINSFVSLSEESAKGFRQLLFPGENILPHVPVPQSLPTPWASFKHQASTVKMMTTQMQEVPMKFVGQGLLKGTSDPSLVSDLVENCYMEKDYNVIKSVAATSFATGSEIIVASLQSFFLAMSLFPEAQKSAQEEIDRVIGSQRLPTINDRPALRYVEAVFRELMRWAPPSPLNAPHMSVEDDIYKGYYIPKGTSVYANIWAMTRDESKYPNSDQFIPDRFIDENGGLNGDSAVLAFGFGRRICSGRHLASTTIWLTIASVLATFDIAPKKKQNDGPSISTKDLFAEGLVSPPLPFECNITPRRAGTATLIHEAAGV